MATVLLLLVLRLLVTLLVKLGTNSQESLDECSPISIAMAIAMSSLYIRFLADLTLQSYYVFLVRTRRVAGSVAAVVVFLVVVVVIAVVTVGLDAVASTVVTTPAVVAAARSCSDS